MDKVGIGIIGTGLMGSLFARIASQLADCELIGVADIDEARVTQLSESLNTLAFTHYEGLLEAAKLDAVVIATPDRYHVEPALAAAQAGKHVLIEKPLATTYQDARRILESCRDENVTLMVAHVLRFDPNYGEAFKAIRTGKLGDVVHLNARRNTSIDDAERLAGRVSITFYLGVHSIDAMQWIVGSPIVEVTAMGVRNVMSKWNVDDAVISMFRFEDGAIGTLENSWIRPRGSSSTQIGASFSIMGTDGALQIEPYRAGFNLYRGNGIEPAIPSYSFDQTVWGKISGSYRDELAHFIECIRTRGAPLISGEQALSSVLVCNAIEQSLHERQTVYIDQENVFA